MQTLSIATASPQVDLKRGVDYIGVTCVFYCHDGNGQFLLHKRSAKCRDEQGRWDCGGGSMEFGETFEDAVRREIREEYGAEVLDLRQVAVTNVLRVRNDGVQTHWVAPIFLVHVNSSQVKIGEPEKMDEIGWFEEGKWPDPLHSCFLNHFELVKNSGVYVI